MRILILGCGWVGTAFAKYAVSKGSSVVGTTTSPAKYQQLSDMSVHVVVHDVDQDSVLALDNSSFDCVLNSIPASKKTATSHISKRFRRITETLQQISFHQHIYLSSVGIYPDTSELFDETYPLESDLNPPLLTAEKLMLQLPSTIVYRLGGLFGKERIFAKYFQDRVCTTGDQPANFIHLDDVVHLIWLGFHEPLRQRTYNIVTPEHPSKRMVIERAAQKYGYRLPSAFEPRDSFQKIVDGSLIAKELGYQYRYPSPLVF